MEILVLLIVLFIAFIALSSIALVQAQNKKVQYCPGCKHNVVPEKQFNWLVFSFLLGVLYLPFYIMKKPTCPICGLEKFYPPQFD